MKDQIQKMRRGTYAIVVMLIAAVTIAACSSTPQRRPYKRYPVASSQERVPLPPSTRDARRAITPPHMAGRPIIRAGLLLPLTTPSGQPREIGQALLNAAQLALFDFNNPNTVLIVEDTQGTEAGAQAAARAAITQGAEILIGPLFAPSVTAVAPLARRNGVPVIAFSSDSGVTEPGVFLLSFLPEQEVVRVVGYAVEQGLYRIAALIPFGAYGSHITAALTNNAQNQGATVVQMEVYPQNTDGMFEPVRRIADYSREELPLSETPFEGIPADDILNDNLNTDNIALLPSISETTPYRPYDAVILPEGGDLLRGLASLLPYFDVDPRKVKFLGTGLWDDPTLAREPALVGGWFAAPPPGDRTAFAKRYFTVFAKQPPRIASLAYDAISLVGLLAGRAPDPDQRFSYANLLDPRGFAGVDGLFRFREDGTTQRGLAVMEVRADGFIVVDPAPNRFEDEILY